MDPYERWRQAVWATSIVVIMLLAGGILLTVFGLFLAAVNAGQTGTQPGY